MALIKCPECGKQISDKAENCIHCGCPILKCEDSKESDFVKSEIEVDTETLIKTEYKKSKTRNIIIGIVAVIAIIGIYILATTPLTEEAKRDRIYDVYFDEGYDAAVELIYEYFGTSDTAIAMMMVLTDPKDEEVIGNIDIQHSLSKYGNYFDYIINFTNNSDETITYIKYTVYLKDDNGNTIHSDWSNWSGTLKPNAKVNADTMIDYIEGVKQYSVEINEISY